LIADFGDLMILNFALQSASEMWTQKKDQTIESHPNYTFPSNYFSNRKPKPFTTLWTTQATFSLLLVVEELIKLYFSLPFFVWFKAIWNVQLLQEVKFWLNHQLVYSTSARFVAQIQQQFLHLSIAHLYLLVWNGAHTQLIISNQLECQQVTESELHPQYIISITNLNCYWALQLFFQANCSQQFRKFIFEKQCLIT